MVLGRIGRSRRDARVGRFQGRVSGRRQRATQWLSGKSRPADLRFTRLSGATLAPGHPLPLPASAISVLSTKSWALGRRISASASRQTQGPDPSPAGGASRVREDRGSTSLSLPGPQSRANALPSRSPAGSGDPQASQAVRCLCEADARAAGDGRQRGYLVVSRRNYEAVNGHRPRSCTGSVREDRLDGVELRLDTDAGAGRSLARHCRGTHRINAYAVVLTPPRRSTGRDASAAR